jgi:hypothetical protein
MTVKEYQVEETKPQNPWVQTPLRESYALSEAAGWYGHLALLVMLLYTDVYVLARVLLEYTSKS